MKIILNILFVLLISYTISYSQPVTWMRWYDYNNRESDGLDVIQTFDGGYLILSNNYFVDFSTVLFKINYLGIVEWQKLFDKNTVGGGSLVCYTVTQLADSGYDFGR